MRRGGGWLVGAALLISTPSSWAQRAPGDPGRFEHSIWQWVEASGLTPARRAALCPHLPQPALTGDVDGDIRAYDHAIRRWSLLWPLEYEALINSPEMAALNPYYDGYVQPSKAAPFLGAPIALVGPLWVETGDRQADELRFELSRQNWLFVFDPGRFAAEYGYQPRLPEGFDAQDYRRQMRDQLLGGAR